MTSSGLGCASIGLALLAFLSGGAAMAGQLAGGGQLAQDGETRFSNLVGTLSYDVSAVPTAEKVLQTPVSAGTLSKLKVNVALSNAGGSAAIMIRLNGADTALTCTVTASGPFAKCSSNATVQVPNNARLAVRLINTSGNGSGALFNYSLLFD